MEENFRNFNAQHLKASKQEKRKVWFAQVLAIYDNTSERLPFQVLSVMLQLFPLCLCPVPSCELGSRGSHEEMGSFSLSQLFQQDPESTTFSALSLPLLPYLSPVFTHAGKMACSMFPLWAAELLILRIQSCQFWKKTFKKYFLSYQHPPWQYLEESQIRRHVSYWRKRKAFWRLRGY